MPIGSPSDFHSYRSRRFRLFRMGPIGEQGVATDKGRTLTELCIRRANGALESELTLSVVTCCAVLAAVGLLLRRMAQGVNSIRGGVAKYWPHYRRPQ